MPSTLFDRRSRGFRPQRYSERHEQVALLLAYGRSRDDIARLTGYSRTHVSRISRMPTVRREVARLLTADALALCGAVVRQIIARQSDGRESPTLLGQGGIAASP